MSADPAPATADVALDQLFGPPGDADLECKCATPDATCAAPEHGALAPSSPPDSPPSHSNSPRAKPASACRGFLSFFGVTWLVSSAYIDPGSIQGDLSQGAYTGYCLLWVTFWATVVGYAFQTLAARIGVVTGNDLAANIRATHPSRELHCTIWLFMELAAVGCDIQALIGSAFALNMLFGLAFWAGCLVTTAGCLLITVVYHLRSSLVESFVGGCVTVLVVCYVVQAGISAPPAGPIFVGWIAPTSPAYAKLVAIGTIGALIMPNAVFLHSSLVVARRTDRGDVRAVADANRYSALENAVGMGMSFVANLCIVCVFAAFFSPDCAAQGLAAVAGGGCGNIGLNDVGDTLASLWGPASRYVFAVGLYLSGVASVISSTLCSQVIMEGFTRIKMGFGRRMLLTRALALAPTLALCLVYGTDAATLSVMNEWINISMSFFLPFAIVPALQISRNQKLMGAFATGPKCAALLWAIVAIVMGINAYLVVVFIYYPDVMGSVGAFPDSPLFYTCVGAGFVIYLYCSYVLLCSGRACRRNRG